MLHRHTAPGQEWHGQRTAANAENRRSPANHAAGHGQTEFARHGSAGLGFDLQRQLRGDHQGENTNELLQVGAGNRFGRQRAKPGTDQNADGHPHEDRPTHGATAVMLAYRVDRGKDDRRQGGTHRQVREDRRIEPLGLEAEHQHRDDDDPAAHAKQPGEYTCTGAERQIEQKFHGCPARIPKTGAAW
ncbi:hypothetical protein D3C72_1562780 [compost metagenome]